MFSFNLCKYQVQNKRKEGLEKMWLSNNKQKHPLLLFANAIVKRSKKINCAMKTDHFGEEVDTTAMLKLTNQKFMVLSVSPHPQPSYQHYVLRQLLI